MQTEYVNVLKVQGRKKSMWVACAHAIVPLGEKVLAILGRDRILYASLDTDVGKEYAAMVLKGIAWNVKKIKPFNYKRSIVYFIPRGFANNLGIKKGTRVLAIGSDGTLQIIPIEHVIKTVGAFKEPILS